MWEGVPMSVEGTVEVNEKVNRITGKITSIPAVDITLTKRGYAADAKEVGVRLKSLETSMKNVMESVEKLST